MQRLENKSHGTQLLESNREENCWSTTPEKGLDKLQQKPDARNCNNASKFSESSQAIKQETDDLLPRQNAHAENGVSKSHKEERAVSCKSAKFSDKSDVNPALPAQYFDQNQVSHLMRDENVLEKLQPSRNVDSGTRGLESEKGNISSKLRGNFPKVPKGEPDNFQLTEDCEVQTSEICDGGGTVKKEMDSDILLPVTGSSESSRSHEQKLTHDSTRPEKALKILQSTRNLDSGDCNSHSGQEIILSNVTEKLSIVPKDEPVSNNLMPRQCLDAGNHALVSMAEKCDSVKRERGLENLLQVHSLSPVSLCDQRFFTKKAEKLQPRRNPDSGVRGPIFQGIPLKLPEKGVDDGYNWRKYGQKFVKGKVSIRSYYKCTHPNCQAKKQIERSHHSNITDVNYLGKHQHPKQLKSPHVTSDFQVRIAEMSIPTASNGGSHQHIEPAEPSSPSTVSRGGDGATCVVLRSSDETDGCPDTKRQKSGSSITGDTVINKPHYELRHVVQTKSEVDLVNDGYRWRKYGQKLVKGNPNPRSYYRCSNVGCPVKKHVERASHDPKVVITAYEGQHDHDMPCVRRGSQNGPAYDVTNMMTTDSASKSKPEETNIGRENGCSC